jgi:hypothetical protein
VNNYSQKTVRANQVEFVANTSNSGTGGITLGYLIGRYLDLAVRTMIVVKIIELSNIFK